MLHPPLRMNDSAGSLAATATLAVEFNVKMCCLFVGDRSYGAGFDLLHKVMGLRSDATYYPYDFDTKYRYSVHVVGTFESHTVTLVQPIVSDEELAGRKPKWFALDVLVARHCLPVLRVRAFDKARQPPQPGEPPDEKFEYKFETKRFVLCATFVRFTLFVIHVTSYVPDAFYCMSSIYAFSIFPSFFSLLILPCFRLYVV